MIKKRKIFTLSMKIFLFLYKFSFFSFFHHYPE